MTAKTRILLVDDHPLFRDGIRSVLSNEPDLEVVGEASNAPEAIKKATLLRPNIVVMDVQMPGMNGIEATAALKEKLPDTHIIILTVNEEEAFLLKAIQAGASGYVLKDASSTLLVNSIRTIMQGGNVLPVHLLEKVLAGAESSKDASTTGDEINLTARELEVLKLLARGYGNQKIAEELNVAVITVKKHMQSILSKLKVSDRTQAALKALRMGLVD